MGCHFLLQGISPTQGLTPCLLCLLNWQAGSVPLSHQGSPNCPPNCPFSPLQEKQTEKNTGLQLNICFNYGGRDEIIHATKNIAKQVKEGKINIDDIDEKLFANNLYTVGIDDPDLLIRTSGELRTSNFLPWQITYSEFIFLDKYWPDFNNEDIDYCIEEYMKRQRRRGK